MEAAFGGARFARGFTSRGAKVLVDTQVSEACGSNPVEVQVLSTAPIVTVVEPPLVASDK